MDIQNVAQQLIGYLGNNPELITQFVEHPYSTTAAATGSDEKISQKDMSKIVTQVAAQTNGQTLGATDTSNLASVLMGQNNGSVHDLASALFGGSTGTSSMAQIAAKSVAGGLAARGMASLITTAMGSNTNASANANAKKGATPQVPDFSELAKLAGGLLGK